MGDNFSIEEGLQQTFQPYYIDIADEPNPHTLTKPIQTWKAIVNAKVLKDSEAPEC